MNKTFTTIPNPENSNFQKVTVNKPYVGEDAIYVPVHTCSPQGCGTSYRVLITKQLFIEAYNKWIKGEQDE